MLSDIDLKVIEMNDHEISKYLKDQGLDFEERVKVFERLFPFDEAAINKQRMELETQYNNDPTIESKYREDFKLEEFIPAVGFYFHDKRKNKQENENYLFFRKANEGTVNWLKRAGFFTYHYLSTTAPILWMYDLLK